LKVRSDQQSVTNSGKLFHARGPATTKALSPRDERRVAGTTRADDDADRTSLSPNSITAILYNTLYNKSTTNRSHGVCALVFTSDLKVILNIISSRVYVS